MDTTTRTIITENITRGGKTVAWANEDVKVLATYERLGQPEVSIEQGGRKIAYVPAALIAEVPA